MFGSTKTLQTILAGFHKTVADLEAFATSSRQAAEKKRFDAETLVTEAGQLEIDAEKAESVRENIPTMVG